MSPWLSDLLLRSQSDERLITLAHLGHKRAFELIVDRYRRPLTAYARRIDPNRADDLVQQTFLAALSSLQAGAEVRHLRGWLYEILRNQARREYASSPVLMELEEADSVTDSAEQVAERRMLAVDALGAVAQLPARQHDAMVQMAFHGLSRAEVAESMGLSEGAVRQLVHRARAAVRTAVTAITPMPVVRWLYTPRSGSGLTEAALGAGTASGAGAGIALKVSVGAIVAGGVVAGGVFSAVAPHHRADTRLASRSPVARIEPAYGRSGGGTHPPTVTNQSGVTPRRGSSGISRGDGGQKAGGRPRFTTSHASATVRGDGGGAGSSRGSRSDSSRGGDGRSSSGPGPGDGGSGSSGTGSGDHGLGGSDGAGTTSGGGGSDGGGPGPSGSSGSGGSDGGGVTLPVVGATGDDGQSSGGNGGPVSSGGPGPGSGGDGGGSTSSGPDSGFSSGTSSDSSTGSDGGSGSSGSGSSGSGSGFPTSDGH